MAHHSDDHSRPLPYVEENLRLYLEMSTDWAYALDGDLHIVNCFKNSDLTFGPHPADMLGQHFCDLLPEESRDKIAGLLESCRVQESARFLITYLDGEGHLIELNAISIWKNGAFEGFKVLMNDRTLRMRRGWVRTDFTEQEQPASTDLSAEQASAYWEAQARQYELLAAVSLAFSGSRPFETTVNQVLEMIGAYLDSDRCVITRINHKKQTQYCLYEWHSPHTHSALSSKQKGGFGINNAFYRMLITSPYVGVSDTARMPGNMQEEFVIQDEKSFIHLPIFIDDELFGSFGVDFCRTRHVWTASEIGMFQTIANCFATVIQKHRTEEQLTETNTLLQRVIRNHPGIMWYCDLEYQCSLFDGDGLDLLGLRSDMFVGRNVVEAHIEQDAPEIAGMIEDTFTQGPQRLTLEKRGRYLTLTTTPVTSVRGEVIGMVGACLDITDVHRMQQELETAITQARDANRAKSDFLSRMSHEIRTPMNAIIGMNTIARKTDDLARIRYCLDKINTASVQLLGLINDILDMSKIEANKLELSESEFDFENMLQNICHVMDVQIAEKKHNFIIDFSEIFERRVIADELRLSQVLLNLLNNAVKFTPAGGTIVLKIRHRFTSQDTGSFFIDVSDTGIGISEDQRRRLFNSFEQADSSITRRYGGTGLGLSICRSIVEMMGGSISVTSQPGQGTCFSFQANVRWGEVKGAGSAESPLPADDLRILVIDDSPDVLEYFHNILEFYSLGCDTAADGMTGFRMVQESVEQDREYNFIFVDWMMPGMDGIETARMIKKLVSDDVIVIMISVADWSDIEHDAAAIGVDRFLAKPILPSRLFDSIVEWSSAAHLSRSAGTAPAATPDWSGRTLLLVEDIDINREIIISMLQGTGLDIHSAENGRVGADLYLEQSDLYDIILMDLQMPELDGFEATALIRGSGRANAATVPIIAMTANAFQEDVQQCLAAGMNDHIAKPVDFDDLFDRLTCYLEQERSMTEQA